MKINKDSAMKIWNEYFGNKKYATDFHGNYMCRNAYVNLTDDSLNTFMIPYSSITGIAYKINDHIDSWSYGNGKDVRFAPNEWRMNASTTDEYGNQIDKHNINNFSSLNYSYTINQDYYDKFGVFHKNEKSEVHDISAKLDYSRGFPGGSELYNKYKGIAFESISAQLKTNKCYGKIYLKDLSFSVSTGNCSFSDANGGDNHYFVPVTLDYSKANTGEWNYDSRPTTRVYYYDWDGYFIRAEMWHHWSTYTFVYSSLIGVINGNVRELQVFGFSFYFDEEMTLEIPNVQSIDIRFKRNGKQYHKTYTDFSTNRFEKFFASGYDSEHNMLVSKETFPRACERTDKTFDYALVHHFNTFDDKDKYGLKEVEPLEITYLDENFSIQKATSDSLGLHIVDGKVYDSNGNLRLDYTAKAVEVVDSGGDKNPIIEFYDKDGNKSSNTGKKIETTSNDPFDNFINDVKDKINSFKNKLGNASDKVKKIVAIVLGAIFGLIVIRLIVKLIFNRRSINKAIDKKLRKRK